MKRVPFESPRGSSASAGVLEAKVQDPMETPHFARRLPRWETQRGKHQGLPPGPPLGDSARQMQNLGILGQHWKVDRALRMS